MVDKFNAMSKNAHPHWTPSVRNNSALCSDCALPIAGGIAGEILGRSVLDFVPLELQAGVLERTRLVLETGEGSGMSESPLVRLDGELIHVESTSIPIMPVPTTTAVSPSRTGVRFTAWKAMETDSISAACSNGRLSGRG